MTSASGEATIAARAAPKPIKLYAGWFCPFAQRAWIALEELGVDYEYVECELYEGGPHTKKSLPLAEKRRRNGDAFVACCPRGLVPGLEDNAGGARRARARTRASSCASSPTRRTAARPGGAAAARARARARACARGSRSRPSA